jgi:YidC/Oxa1 family membrane protein insertase
VLEYRYRKNMYIIIIVVVCVVLSQKWSHEQLIAQKTFQKSNHVNNVLYHRNVTPLGQRKGFITIKTDIMNVWIQKKGAIIERLDILKYKKKLHGKQPVSLLGLGSNNTVSMVQSGFTGGEHLVFSSMRQHYVLGPHARQLKVVLIAQNTQNKTTQKKTYIFSRNSYVVKVEDQLINHSHHTWKGRSFMAIDQAVKVNVGLWQRKLGYTDWHHQAKKSSGFTVQALRSYSGFAYHTHKKPYVKLSESTITKNGSGIEQVVSGGWIANQQPYFIRAWIPQNARQRFIVSAEQKEKNNYQMVMKSNITQVLPGKNHVHHAALYVGPEITKNLKPLAPGLALTVDYGMLWILADFIYWMMAVTFKYIHNWGWSIIIVTLFIRALLYHFSEKSFRATITMRDIKPKMDAIKKRYAKDSTEQRKAVAALYAKEKVDPVGGCLPNLLTLPIFFALYFVLIESVELRHAPFMFWIQDLSAKDPLYIFPVLYGISMWFQQRVNPPTPGAFNQDFMTVMPVMMTVLFATFPVGLILYMLANNLFMAIHNWWVNKKMGVYDDGYQIVPWWPKP